MHVDAVSQTDVIPKVDAIAQTEPPPDDAIAQRAQAPPHGPHVQAEVPTANRVAAAMSPHLVQELAAKLHQFQVYNQIAYLTDSSSASSRRTH